MTWHRRITDEGRQLAAWKAGLARDLGCLALLAVLCLWSGLPRYSSELDFRDEGLLAYGGVRVMDGQVPSRDFVTLQPPLSFYVAAAAFKCLGTSLWSLRLLGLGIYVLIPLLSYGIARNFNGPLLALAAALPSLVLGISYAHFVPVAVWQGVTACLAAALLYLRAVANSGSAWRSALPAGLLTACAFLLKQDQGFYLALSLLIYTAILKFLCPARGLTLSVKAPLAWWAAGLALVFLPLGIFWMAASAIEPMWRQLVLFPVTTYARTSSLPFPGLRSGLTFGPNASVLLYYLPLVVLPIAALLLVRQAVRRNFGAREAGLAFLLAWAALFYCQVLVRTDMDHLLIALPPFFILVATGCREAFSALDKAVAPRPALHRAMAWTLPAAAGTLAMGFLLLLKPAFLPPPLNSTETIALERAGVRKAGAANLKKFVERIQNTAPPDRPILCLPYQPMFYFLCERRNPTRWNYLWPGDQTAEDHQALIQQAENDPPAVVLLTGEPDLRTYAPGIVDYVHRDYRPAFTAGGQFRVYVRK